MNKVVTTVKYICNLNEVYYRENETFVKQLQNLRQYNADVSEAQEAFQRDVKSNNLLKQNNKVMAQTNQKIKKNSKSIEENRKIIDKLCE